MRLTHIGGPTVLLELAGWRILTDPTFDPPGRKYGFGWGTSSRKTVGPAVPATDIGPVDLALLSHDHHADNLDDLGRQVLGTAGALVTTVPAARRLASPATDGLRPWQTTRLHAADKPTLTVTATPCRHGPPLSRPVAGSVVGFALQIEGHPGAVWMTGDTVLYRGVREVPRRFEVDTILVHTGRVRFPITGPLTYSMGGAEAIELALIARPRLVVPVHYDGWSHFSEQRSRLQAVLGTAPDSVRERLVWLEPGQPAELADPPQARATVHSHSSARDNPSRIPPDA
jgi:L-ascorbate metabolism protein UlaG (beta-lactamase superfamily)